MTVLNKYERVIQIYNWYRTARLNVLYYEESLQRWNRAVRTHDVIIALSGAGSPVAFWQRSAEPIQKQAWFYLTLLSGISAMLKPILRWDKKLTLFAELSTHYRDLWMDLKCLCEDMAAASDLTVKSNSLFEHHRATFKALERKEPPQDNPKVKRLEKKVKVEIDINNYWLPPEGRGPINAARLQHSAGTTTGTKAPTHT